MILMGFWFVVFDVWRLLIAIHGRLVPDVSVVREISTKNRGPDVFTRRTRETEEEESVTSFLIIIGFQ